MSELKEALINISEEVRTKVIPENIKAGVQIFDTEGEYTGLDTSDATATAEDILKDKTAYVNGEKVTGTMEAGASDNNATVYTSLQAGTQSGNKLASLIKKLPPNLIVTKNVQGKYVADYAFIGATNLQELEFDMSKITNANCMLNSCTNLKKVKLTDTSKVTDFYRFAYNAKNLVDIDINSFASATNCGGMFTGCTSLSDESLNNILKACITKPTPSTLSGLGLTSDQATICQGLSNYQAFLDAGWTTGY